MDASTYVTNSPTLAGCVHRAVRLFRSKPFLGVRKDDPAAIQSLGACSSGNASGLLGVPASPGYSFISFEDFGRAAQQAAAGITAASLESRHVGLMMRNRPEWLVSDVACCLADVPSVGLHTSWPVNEIAFVLDNATIGLVIVDAEHAAKVAEACQLLESQGKALPQSVHVVCGAAPGQFRAGEWHEPPVPSTPGLAVAWHQGMPAGEAGPSMAISTPPGGRREDPADLDGLFSLIFTSGSTGRPKGVVTTKRRWKSDNAGATFAGQENPCAVSYLSLSHGADRGIAWQSLLSGTRLGMAAHDSHEGLLDDLQALRPTMLLGMPTLWGRLYDDYSESLVARCGKAAAAVALRVEAAVAEALCADEAPDAEGRAALAAAAGRSVGRAWAARHMEGWGTSPCVGDARAAAVEESTDWPALEAVASYSETAGCRSALEAIAEVTGAQAECRDEVRRSLGGRVVLPVTGGGPTSDRIRTFFGSTLASAASSGEAADRKMRDSYGATEFPGIAQDGEVNPLVELRLEAVEEMGYRPDDKPFPRGEIWVRLNGPGRMVGGYWRNPEANAKAFDADGWYHTGDIGELDNSDPATGQGLLRIIDRRKNFLELYAAGRSVWVQADQLMSDMAPLVPAAAQLFLHGDRNESRLVAAVVPTTEAVAAWWSRQMGNGGEPDRAAVCADVAFRKHVLRDIVRAAARLGFRAGAGSTPESAARVPVGVVLEPELWTHGEGLATNLGKLRRGPLVARLQDRFFAVYAEAERAAGAGPADAAADTPAAGADAPAPAAAAAGAEVEAVAAVEAGDAVEAPSASGAAVAKAPLQRRRSVGHAAPLPLTDGALAAWGAVVRAAAADAKLRPWLPQMTCRDYIDFKFSVPGNEEVEQELNQSLAEAAQLALTIRRDSDDWIAEIQAVKRAALEGQATAAASAFEELLLPLVRAAASRVQAPAAAQAAHQAIQGLEAEVAAARHLQPPQQQPGVPASVVASLLDGIESLSDEQLVGRVATALAECRACIASVRQFWTQRLGNGKTAEETRVKQGIGAKVSALQQRAALFRVRVPFQIWACGWWKPPQAAGEPFKMPNLNQQMGSAESACFVTGLLLEDSCDNVGGARWHCNEDAKFDAAPFGADLLRALWALAPGHSAICELDARHLVVPAPAADPTPLWVQAPAHPWQQRVAVPSPIVDFVDPTTPASFIWNALQAFGDRPALGVPDCPPAVALGSPAAADRIRRGLVQEALALAGCGAATAEPSAPDEQLPAPVAAASLLRSLGCGYLEAAGCPPLAAQGYKWVTFRQLQRLVSRTARALRALPGVERGDVVAICGYNTPHWAIVDFAAAVAGLRPVGIHVTADPQTAQHMLTAAGATVLACVAEVLVPSSAGAGASGAVSWSLPQLRARQGGVPSLKHAVVLDVAPSDELMGECQRACGDMPVGCWQQAIAADADVAAVGGAAAAAGDAEAAAAAGGEATAPFTPFIGRVLASSDSATAVLTPAAGVAGLEPAVSQPADGKQSMFTLLFTSGSSGLPKAVAVSAESFLADVNQPVFLEPLVTPSYIPLSHSSDRMKMWQFLGNGGRVGFASYDASNWAAHEKSKKDEMVASAATGTNNVEGLFAQLRLLRATAIACPPRIWNGLLALRRHLAAAVVAASGDAAAAKHASRRVIAGLLGDRVKNLATGGGPTAPSVVAFAKSLVRGAKFVDSFGTTEAGGVLSNGRPIQWQQRWTEVRLVSLTAEVVDGVLPEALPDDAVGSVGEMWVRSPNMNTAYWNAPEESAKAFVDGWLRTGDVGQLVGLLSYKILGRVKSARVLPGGGAVFPSSLEALLETSADIQHAFVDVDVSSGSVVALVVPSGSLAAPARAPAGDTGSIASEAGLLAVGAAAAANEVPAAAIPRLVCVVEDEWSVQTGMLNGEHKKRRAAIAERYAASLLALHHMPAAPVAAPRD